MRKSLIFPKTWILPVSFSLVSLIFMGCQKSKISTYTLSPPPSEEQKPQPDEKLLADAAKALATKQDLFTFFQISAPDSAYQDLMSKGNSGPSIYSAEIHGPDKMTNAMFKANLWNKELNEKVLEIQKNLDQFVTFLNDFFLYFDSLQAEIKEASVQALGSETLATLKMDLVLFGNLQKTLSARIQVNQAVDLETKIRSLRVQVLDDASDSKAYLLDKSYLSDKSLTETDVENLNQIKTSLEQYQTLLETVLATHQNTQLALLGELTEQLMVKNRLTNAKQILLFANHRLGKTSENFFEIARSLREKGLILDDNPDGPYLSNSKTALFGWVPSKLNFREIDLSTGTKNQLDTIKLELQSFLEIAKVFVETNGIDYPSDGEKFFWEEAKKQVLSAQQAYDCIEFKLSLDQVIKLEKTLGQIGLKIAIYEETNSIEFRLAPSVDAKTIYLKLNELKLALERVYSKNNHALNLGRSKTLIKAELTFVNDEIEKIKRNHIL